MCTVSWVHHPRGYDLLFNRDEKRSRGLGLPPTVRECGGVRYIAPLDSDRGGTWIEVNEFGVSLCLLNGGSAPGLPQRSRGHLLRELVTGPSTRECMLALHQLDLRHFAPFTLVTLEPGRPATLATWDATNLTVDPAGDAHMPLTSSSYDTPGVRQFRLNELARQIGPAGSIDAAALRRFHASHGESPDAYSPCMHRSDAQTVSLSRIQVQQHEIRFWYSPAAPCQADEYQPQILTRAA
jgi:hypothetical protein